MSGSTSTPGSWFRRILPADRPVRFETHLPVVEAVRRLEAIVEPFGWRRFVTETIRGKVSTDAVSLERVIPLFTNSWRPMFEGRIEAAPVGSALVGSFGLSTYTRRFMLVFIGFGVMWSLMAGCTVAMTPQPELPFWFPFAGLGMAGVGVVVSHVAHALSSGDIEWLSGRIRNALHTSAGGR